MVPLLARLLAQMVDLQLTVLVVGTLALTLTWVLADRSLRGLR